VSAEQKLETVFAFMGALVPLMSALASLINHYVREAQAAGEDVSPLMLKTGAVLNVGAVNIDKAVQLARLAKKGKSNAAKG
jgi:hypothetical protein